MRLTAFSDYSLRVLVYLGAHGEHRASVADIAAAYGISRNHLTKVVRHLALRGHVETARGKGGGMRLARAPGAINVGALVREAEQGPLVECFERGRGGCRIERACVLRGVLSEALEAFFAVLDRHTLADLLVPRSRLARVLVLPRPVRAGVARAGR